MLWLMATKKPRKYAVSSRDERIEPREKTEEYSVYADFSTVKQNRHKYNMFAHERNIE